VEGLRGDIKTIAEGHSLLNEKLDILREENAKEHKELHREIDNLRGENTEEHKEILSELKLSYAELDHRVSTLENK